MDHSILDVNVEEYVRAVLDGVCGDIDLPTSYWLPTWDEPKVGGLTRAQREVFEQVEKALVARVRRPLRTRERDELSLVFALEYNRRAEDENERRGERSQQTGPNAWEGGIATNH